MELTGRISLLKGFQLATAPTELRQVTTALTVEVNAVGSATTLLQATAQAQLLTGLLRDIEKIVEAV